MSQFQLFDGVKLTEEISLTDGGVATVGTSGAIVEVLKDGEAYLVELFGGWVKYDEQGNFLPASEDEEEAFMETIGVELVYPHQLVLTVPARQTMGVREYLETILDNLPEEKLVEIRDFAEFLQQRQKSA
ncbi:hypothetical protein [Chroococcus sp. FPU101]|uniref:hypothetical protein n=1 Tax=Chroococcus sp. FPU101 TaxID=1974212 RepID=UPI001A90AD8C|nr:hypothetical protein [Chroococcus sp. FPU101]GFE71739.1 hypothetical protein CFPU101_43490 [Chroococcus sp. FPU101]